MTQSIARKLEEMLADDKTFDTRAGLRFMAELVKDAFQYIEDEKKHQQDTDTMQASIITRITNVENGLNEFLKLRKSEQEKAEAERSKWRWAFLTPTIGLVLTELVRWWMSKP